MLTFGFSDTLWGTFNYDPINSWNNCIDISNTNKLKKIFVLRKIATLHCIWYTPGGEFWHLENKTRELLVKGLKV